MEHKCMISQKKLTSFVQDMNAYAKNYSWGEVNVWLHMNGLTSNPNGQKHYTIRYIFSVF